MDNFLIFIFALAGLFISWLIYHTKSRGKKLVCVIGKDCDLVVHSRYNNLFGIHLEIFGMTYYTFIALSVFFPVIPSLYILIITGFAALFSVALTYIQAFVIKEWCEYCLLSAVLTVVIFIIRLVEFL